MLKIFIQGMKDGVYDVDVKSAVIAIPDISQEFIGDINLVGKLRILSKRYSFSGKVFAVAKLECDLSLEEYEENIEFEIKASFLADNELYFMQGDKDIIEKEEHIIHEDDKYLDMTQEIREDLIVHLPMKRISPKYRGKSFIDIHPELVDKKSDKKKKKSDEPADDRWSVLKNIKLN